MKEVLQMTNEELNTALYEKMFAEQQMKFSITAMSSR